MAVNLSTFLPGWGSGQLAVEIAWGAQQSANYKTWTWSDVTADVRLNPGISTRTGRSDEASTAQPAKCSLVLDNTSGAYSRSGESTNYPYVRQGTPVRVRVDPDGSGTWLTLFSGFAVSWEPSWAPTGGIPVVALTAAGALRRLGQGQSPLESPVRRQLENAPEVVAYWPCTDGAEANWFASVIGSRPMLWSGTPGVQGNSEFEVTEPIAKMNNASASGIVDDYTSAGTTAAVNMLISCPSTHDATNGVLLRVWTDYNRYDLLYDDNAGASDGDLQVRAYDLSGVGYLTGSYWVLNMNLDPRPRRIQMEFAKVGSDVQIKVYTNAQASSYVTHSFTETLTGAALGKIRWVQVNPDKVFKETAFGHVAVMSSPLASTDDEGAAGGWRGEASQDRMARLAGENDILLDSIGTSDTTLGYQPLDTFLAIARDAELADGGVLYDGRTPGLVYAPRAARENRAPDLTLDASAKDLAPDFSVVDDDQRVRNRAKITRKDGSQFTYEDATGVLGVNAIGAYETSATVNVETDEQARNYASWLVRLGTVEGYRYPTCTANLRVLTAAQRRAALGLWPSSRIDVTGLSSVLTSSGQRSTVSLMVEGLEAKIAAGTFTVSATCSAYRPWNVFQWENEDTSPSFVAAGTKVEAASPTSGTYVYPTVPAGTLPGDLVLVFVGVATGTIDVPVDVTELYRSGGVSVLGWIATGTDEYTPPIYVSGGATGGTLLLDTVSLRGVDRRLSSVLVASAVSSNASSANVAYPSLTVPEDNCIVLAVGWKASSWTSVATLAGMTEAVDVTSTAGTAGAGLVVDYVAQTTKANIVGGSFVVTGGAAAVSTGLTLAFRRDTDRPTARYDTDGSTLTSNISAGATSMQVTTTGAGPISYVGIGAVAGANNASVTPALPTGLVDGDLLLLVAAIRNSGTGTVNTPNGWTALKVSGNLSVFGRRYASDVTAPTVSFSGGAAGADTQAQIMAFRGCNPNVPAVLNNSAAQLNASAQNMAIPGLVAGHDNVAMVLIGWKQSSWTGVAQLSGQFFTEVSDSPSSAGSGQGLEIQYRLGGFNNAKTFTGTNFTVTGGVSAISRSIVLALEPSTVGLWTTNSADYPIDLDVGGVKITATACSGSYSAQTMTINAAPVARTAGAAVKLWQPGALARE